MPALRSLAAALHRPSLWQSLNIVRHRLDQARSRRHLSRLDDRLLRDIGLTREQAEAEGQRPLWDTPPHWRG
jgi:uncharacterized protein YjiS (DUF1127 family)